MSVHAMRQDAAAAPAPPFDSKRYRRAMSQFGTGITVVSYMWSGEARGMTANAFMSLSMDPPMVLISVRNDCRFASYITVGAAFGISILTARQKAISQHFGGQHNAQLPNPFTLVGDVPVIANSLVCLLTRVAAVHVGGDHLIYTAHVDQIVEGESEVPLLFVAGQYATLAAVC